MPAEEAQQRDRKGRGYTMLPTLHWEGLRLYESSYSWRVSTPYLLAINEGREQTVCVKSPSVTLSVSEESQSKFRFFTSFRMTCLVLEFSHSLEAPSQLKVLSILYSRYSRLKLWTRESACRIGFPACCFPQVRQAGECSATFVTGM